MSTLKQLVDETTNIKNELKTCHTNLKNNLIEKGVEVSSINKMGNLINKIQSIVSVVGINKGSGILYEKDETYVHKKDTVYLHDEYKIKASGTITTSIKCWSDIANNQTIIINTERDGVVVFDKTISVSSYNESNPSTVSTVIQDVETGDIVKIYIKKHQYAEHFSVKEYKIKGDYIVK